MEAILGAVLDISRLDTGAMKPQLASFPLTPNNKLDRNALPPPELEDSGHDYVAPTDGREQLVVELFERVLGRKHVSTRANFFELGGHSILAAQLLNAIKREHGVTIPLRSLFEAPTPAALAKLLPVGEQPAADATHDATIPRLPQGVPAPLSSMQQRLWILEQLDPGLAVYNLPSSFRIRGALDVAAFERALHEIARRHETLRTLFQDDQGVVTPVVRESIALPLQPFIDLSGVPAGEREAQLRGLLEAEAAKPFNLTQGPLVSGKLYKLAEAELM